MKKGDLLNKGEFVVQAERTHFHHMLAKNLNYFGNIPESDFEPNFKLISDTRYEELTCVGYNPDTQDMEATFSIKLPYGYSGNLCTNGSFENIRFYMDFHDGAGFIDQGSVRVNVHDIPVSKDCNGDPTSPLSYVATLKKESGKYVNCNKPVLPTLRAIMSWGQMPPANSPNWRPVWGNILNCDVQLKPTWIKPFPIENPFPIDFQVDLSNYLNLAANSPNLTSSEISEISGVNPSIFVSKGSSEDLEGFIKDSRQLKIPESRFAYKTVKKMIQYPTSEITMLQKSILSNADIDFNNLIGDYSIALPKDDSKANVDFEELECVGLDYNTESLVATLQVKMNAGYGGTLCDNGSNEYVSFWIDWEDDCEWKYLNTVKLSVHDIKMKGDALCYSVSLPLDATYFRKLCKNPNIVKIRSVLSWNHPPSTTDPDKLEFFGNRVDAHIQIKPGSPLTPGDVIPLFNIIGGIDVAHVNDSTGLTTPGSFFAFNGTNVPTGAPFGGIVVINGPTFPGYRYKIKVTNLVNGSSYYLSNSFNTVGWLPYAPWVQYTTQSVDVDGYYPFLDPDKNTLNVLARFTPGTEDKLRVDLEVDTVAGVFTQTIQMDNTRPSIKLEVDDNGDCTHFKKGDTITGHFYANDKHIRRWRLNNTWTGAKTGTINTPGLPGTPFSIVTTAASYPCGAISLWAEDKTIVNSQSVGFETWSSYNICLQDA
jgi:hypothetical protein